MLISFTIIFCTKAHGIFSVSFSTRLWEPVFYFWSSLEYSFTQAAVFSALLSGRPQAWRISRHQKLQQRPSRSQIASPLALRKYKCLRYQKQWEKRESQQQLHCMLKEKSYFKKRQLFTQKHCKSPHYHHHHLPKTVSWYLLITQKCNPLCWNSSSCSLIR